MQGEIIFRYRILGFSGYRWYGLNVIGRYRMRSDRTKYEKSIEIRNNPTEAESAMWDIIRHQVDQNFPDYVFYRESVQYGYTLDFYCPKLRLGIEIDGFVDNEQREYDNHRDYELSTKGIEIHRYTNEEVLNHPKETNRRFYETLRFKKEHPEVGIVADEGCFIATAAFGTPMAQEIIILRRFRDLQMKPSLIGRCFVDLYYSLSPPLARVIAQSKNMKAFVRLTLNPIIRYLGKQ